MRKTKKPMVWWGTTASNIIWPVAGFRPKKKNINRLPTGSEIAARRPFDLDKQPYPIGEPETMPGELGEGPHPMKCVRSVVDLQGQRQDLSPCFRQERAKATLPFIIRLGTPNPGGPSQRMLCCEFGNASVRDEREYCWPAHYRFDQIRIYPPRLPAWADPYAQRQTAEAVGGPAQYSAVAPTRIGHTQRGCLTVYHGILRQ